MSRPAGEHSSVVVIVSGLPRSGTSMMMQMLGAAGLPLATDATRAPDADNPRGYFELEAVKRVESDASFLEGASGMAVKVVAPLLPKLPPGREYRVILMERDLGEVLASQRRMLERAGDPDEGAGDAALRSAFERVVERSRQWIETSERVRGCSVSHRRLIESPEEEARAVLQFLAESGVIDPEIAVGAGAAATIERMVASVDPGLHRQRTGQTAAAR